LQLIFHYLCKKIKKMNKRGFITGVFCAALILCGCNGKKETKNQGKIIPVKVMEVSASATENVRNYIGTIEESSGISLGFSNTGTVEQVFVAEGQKVSKGQLLARLNTATAQNAFDATQAQLAQAQDAYDRLLKVHSNGSLPDIRLKEVEAGLQQAKSLAAVSKKSLDDCNLYAPRSGVIAQSHIEAGANVMPGVPAFKLVTVDKVTANFFVPENEINSTRVGQKAVIEVAALGNEKFEGKIETKGISANPVSHSYEVKIGIDNRVGAKNVSPLLPGMVCKVSILQDDATAAIVVPNRAIQIAPDGRTFVWIAGDGLAKRRFVTTGNLADNGITVREGLQAGDRLIVEGYRKVSEGMKISISN
jgi:RND family efflux transporter MFP subunit